MCAGGPTALSRHLICPGRVVVCVWCVYVCVYVCVCAHPGLLYLKRASLMKGDRSGETSPEAQTGRIIKHSLKNGLKEVCFF